MCTYRHVDNKVDPGGRIMIISSGGGIFGVRSERRPLPSKNGVWWGNQGILGVGNRAARGHEPR